MLIKRPRSWEIPESEVTPEGVYLQRRRLLRGAAAGTALLAAGGLLAACEEAGPVVEASEGGPGPWADDPSAGLYPVPRNEAYSVERPLTDERQAITYTNFYEFGSSKNVWREAQRMRLRPWSVAVGGLVEEPFEIAVDDLLAAVPLEERVYRFRCVEAWAMTVPWSGFQLSHLVAMAKPSAGARYIRFTTAEQPEAMSGLRASWYPWPYREGLTLEEAGNELAFVATGIYGKPLPAQNGAPLRLVVPWKYGFKSIKSIVAVEFLAERPETFWETIASNEYGFWANVNPEVSHPRWSQAHERILGTDERVPTQLFNGYAEQVAGLYEGLDPRADRLFM